MTDPPADAISSASFARSSFNVQARLGIGQSAAKDIQTLTTGFLSRGGAFNKGVLTASRVDWVHRPDKIRLTAGRAREFSYTEFYTSARTLKKQVASTVSVGGMVTVATNAHLVTYLFLRRSLPLEQRRRGLVSGRQQACHPPSDTRRIGQRHQHPRTEYQDFRVAS